MSILVIKNATVTRKGSDIQVVWSEGKNLTISTLDLELVVIVGSNVRLTSDVILFLSSLNIPVLIHNKRKDVVLVSPFLNSLVNVRRKFYTMSDDMKLYLAKKFIKGKVMGMTNLAKYFMYLTKVPIEIDLDLKQIDNANTVDELRSVEAEMSKTCWEQLKKFLPESFPGRKPRNQDEVNRAVDYAYSIIYALSTHSLIASGLDPYAGVMHTEYPSRTALTYDFSEMFKPVAVHSVISVSRRVRLKLDNSGYLTKESLRYLTKHLYETLHKGKRSIRGHIYAMGVKTKNFIAEGVDFEPFVYKPK
ncbi:CRISPR-associated endonuclease Cas1 [Sulfolobus sp. E1]|nr:CRISPR-associated endonuclease Cas1 [Sulfolobus sp. E1]